MAEEDSLQNKITKLQKVKQLQVQAMQMQSKMILQQNQEHPLWNLKLAIVPNRHYNINLSEYRTHFKNCKDFKFLTNFTNH